MEFVVVTGLSGGGKSRAVNVLEDFEFYCVDNMPVSMMPKFAELCLAAGSRESPLSFSLSLRCGCVVCSVFARRYTLRISPKLIN